MQSSAGGLGEGALSSPDLLACLSLGPHPACQTESPGAGSCCKHRAGTHTVPRSWSSDPIWLSPAFVQLSGLGIQTWLGSAFAQTRSKPELAIRARPDHAKKRRTLSQACGPSQDLLLGSQATLEGCGVTPCLLALWRAHICPLLPNSPLFASYWKRDAS